MYLRTACLAALALASSLSVVAANTNLEDEPVLRLRFQDKTPVQSADLKLRPRFDAAITQVSEAVPTPKVSVSDAGRVGKFAYVSTPHPNMVVAVGATDDGSELGRQIDRAIMEMTRGEMLFNRQSDSAPFIGLGVRSGSPKTGWSAEASMGVGVVNAPDASRLSTGFADPAVAAYEADARAHFRLRYTF